MSNYLVEDTVKCDECGSRNLKKDESRGEVVCEDCVACVQSRTGRPTSKNRCSYDSHAS